ncbi:MAG: hypothetical protein ACI9G1_002940 [Pirellulaceae bacterium]|jgi:hypothetical protein
MKRVINYQLVIKSVAVLLIIPVAASAFGEIGDPTLRTDHPQYAGEGAFQTVEQCVQFATRDATKPQDKAIAMYMWMLTHQFHLKSPQEWCVAGRTPDTEVTSDYEMVVYDANRSRFSYGYGLCGTVHSWNEPYWNALGMRPRRRAFPGHVNSEIQYNGAWHAFDTDMAGLLFRKDGMVAGYDDIIKDPKLADSVKAPLPHYPFAWPSDFNGMKQGWQQVAAGGNWYKLYNGGYAAHPGIVQVRAGESFTRWFDRDHFGGPSKRRFWHHQKDGPYRNWTFVNKGDPTHTGDSSNCRGNASYCNGEFVYSPQLNNGKYREGTTSISSNMAHREQSPNLFSDDGKTASITFTHFSPYVICGDPVDDENPMSGKATDGFVVETKFVGDVTVEVSADQGQSWSEVKLADSVNIEKVTSGVFHRRFDLTEYVKGRYGWHVRLSWDGDAGIDELQFTTVTQVCQAFYPRLTAGGSTVSYAAGNRGVVAVLPNLGFPSDAVTLFEDVKLRSSNITYLGRTGKSRLAYQTTNNKPATVVFRVDAPHPLEEVRAAFRYPIRVPPPKEYDFHMEVSMDQGKTWQEFAKADIPADNEFSSGWLSGKVDVTSAKSKQALVRLHLYGGGYQTGVMDAQLYGIHSTAIPQPLLVNYGWKESGQLKTHAELIPTGKTQHVYKVKTGKNITNEFVQIISTD